MFRCVPGGAGIRAHGARRRGCRLRPLQVPDRTLHRQRRRQGLARHGKESSCSGSPLHSPGCGRADISRCRLFSRTLDQPGELRVLRPAHRFPRVRRHSSSAHGKRHWSPIVPHVRRWPGHGLAARKPGSGRAHRPARQEPSPEQHPGSQQPGEPPSRHLVRHRSDRDRIRP